MPEGKKQNIRISIAELHPIPLQIDPAKEESYRNAEKLLNGLWIKWNEMFKGKCTSEEVMARVAFQFARLYVDEKRANDNVNNFLAELEKELDELVIKI